MKEKLLSRIAERKITVGVVGLGYVGLPLAVEKAKAGFRTIGFDVQELAKEGFRLTQATLSRDLKQLKVAKAASMNGNYVYVLPNNTMYKRMTEQHSASEMLMHNGFISIEFSANLAVIKTRPGYASSLAYDIDNRNFDEILGTIAGDDTIMLVIREGCTRAGVKNALSLIIPNIQ